MIDTATANALDAQEALAAPILAVLQEYGTEATLTALAEQFGILGATAAIAGIIPPSHFTGVYVLRAMGVCDQLCRSNFIEGVL